MCVLLFVLFVLVLYWLFILPPQQIADLEHSKEESIVLSLHHHPTRQLQVFWVRKL